MKLHLINQWLEKFSQEIKSGNYEPDPLFRSCVLTWQKEFSLDKLDLSESLNKALQNKSSGRLWNGEKFSIKSGLIALAKHNNDLFWESLNDLLNEERQIIMRVNRFIHHCDILLDDMKLNYREVKDHYQNYYSATLLIALNSPSAYCLFNPGMLIHFCKKVEYQNLPMETDLERYYKIINVLYKLVSENDEFMNLYYQHLPK